MTKERPPKLWMLTVKDPRYGLAVAEWAIAVMFIISVFGSNNPFSAILCLIPVPFLALASAAEMHREVRTVVGAYERATSTEIGDRELGYADAITEAMKVMQALGLEPRGPLDVGELVRFVYAQGWLAREARLASPDMADVIDSALNHPGRVTDKSSTDTINSWTVRALQQTIVRGSGNR